MDGKSALVALPTGSAARESQTLLYSGRVQVEGYCGPTLNAWQVFPGSLHHALEDAAGLVVADMLSFPFELLREQDWDLPIGLVLPKNWGPEALIAVFGECALSQVTIFDRVTYARTEVMEALKARFGWGMRQFIEVEAEGEEKDWSRRLVAHAAEKRKPYEAEDGPYRPDVYWSARGARFADSAPDRAVCSVAHSLKMNKIMHRIQARAMRPVVQASVAQRCSQRETRILEVGCGVGRWISDFTKGGRCEYHGTDISAEMLEVAQRDFPEAEFVKVALGGELPYPSEYFDIVASVTVAHHNPVDIRYRMFQEMFRVTRSAGHMLFLEDFVGEAQNDRATTYPISVSDFLQLVQGACSNQVVLEHVDALRYAHSNYHQTGVLLLRKIGIPRRW